MRAFDFVPLMRSSVGFDRFEQLFDGLERGPSDKYPPYNIVKNDQNNYRISMAVAGFTEDEIDITSEQNSLKVTGKTSADDDKVEYLHRGIAKRAFTQNFELADNVKVTSASMDNGMLNIELLREIPEALQPRKISINKTSLLEEKSQ